MLNIVQYSGKNTKKAAPAKEGERSDFNTNSHICKNISKNNCQWA